MKRKWLILFILVIVSFLIACKSQPASTTQKPSSSLETTESAGSDREQYVLSNLSSWGLGSTIISYYSNEREHDWYINQMDTGIHGNNNCGPASVQMAGLWQSADFAHTAAEARSMYLPEGGWWNDTNIAGALDHFGIDYEVSYLSDGFDLMQAIEQGNIVLVNNDMSKIPYNGISETRLNRFYLGVTGHYLIVKGVLTTDAGTYFEVYDPYSGDRFYADDTPRGQNRFYESDVFVESITAWYSKIYLIKP